MSSYCMCLFGVEFIVLAQCDTLSDPPSILASTEKPSMPPYRYDTVNVSSAS